LQKQEQKIFFWIAQTILEHPEFNTIGIYTILMSLIYLGNFEIFKLIIETHNIDLSFENNEYLLAACKFGRIDFVKLLLQDYNINPSDFNNNTIETACTTDHIDIIKLLLADERVDPSVNENQCLVNACKKRSFYVVELLLQDNRIDPTLNADKCLLIASKNKEPGIIQLLLQDQRVDPSFNNNQCLIIACDNGDLDTVEQLLKDERVDPSCRGNAPLAVVLTKRYDLIYELLLNQRKLHFDYLPVVNALLNLVTKQNNIKLFEKFWSKVIEKRIIDGPLNFTTRENFRNFFVKYIFVIAATNNLNNILNTLVIKQSSVEIWSDQKFINNLFKKVVKNNNVDFLKKIIDFFTIKNFAEFVTIILIYAINKTKFNIVNFLLKNYKKMFQFSEIFLNNLFDKLEKQDNPNLELVYQILDLLFTESKQSFQISENDARKYRDQVEEILKKQRKDNDPNLNNIEYLERNRLYKLLDNVIKKYQQNWGLNLQDNEAESFNYKRLKNKI
jgi:hypothetical protein